MEMMDAVDALGKLGGVIVYVVCVRAPAGYC